MKRRMILTLMAVSMLLGGIHAQTKSNKQEYRVYSAPAIVPDAPLFDALLLPFKGKTVLVDIWATWCGPCRQANSAMKPVKTELKDIVYLYITGETSPQETWLSMLPDLGGNHYRLSAEQWDKLGRELGLQGVPTYFIVNEQGKVVYKQVGFPGATRMKTELLNATK